MIIIKNKSYHIKSKCINYCLNPLNLNKKMWSCQLPTTLTPSRASITMKVNKNFFLCIMSKFFTLELTARSKNG